MKKPRKSPAVRSSGRKRGTFRRAFKADEGPLSEVDELKRLYAGAERSLMVRFLKEHPVIHELIQAGPEEIRDHFCNVIRRLSEDGEAESLGLFAMWLVLESSRDTLVNLAVWLEIAGSPDDDGAAGEASDEE